MKRWSPDPKPNPRPAKLQCSHVMVAEWRHREGGLSIIVTGICGFVHERFISTPRAQYAGGFVFAAGYMLSTGWSDIAC